MPQNKKKHSLRLVGVLFVGTAILLFAVLIFGILYSNLPKMLSQAEDQFLQKQSEVVQGVYEDNLDNAYRMTYDVAIWEEAVRYATGEYPTLIEDSWPDATMLDNYRFNFVYIKDAEGNDLHVEFADLLDGEHMEGSSLPEPEGFSDYLDGYARLVLEEYSVPHEAEGTVRELGLGGILFYDDVPYLVGIMPIMSSRDAGEAAGTVIMGIILTSEYMQRMTHFDTVDFAWYQDAGGVQEKGMPRNIITTELAFTDIEGSPVVLQMSDERVIYMEGERLLVYTAILLLIAIVLFGIAVYLIVANLMIVPMEALSRDVGTLEAEGTLDMKPYGGNREFYTLATAINSMVQRLNESNISLTVLQSILDGQDALIYVSDPADDTILFMNENLRDQFEVEGPAVGRHCWEVLHEGRGDRCESCPVGYLADHAGEEVIWEEENRKTGKFFRNTDRMIEWTDGRQVHLHSAVDITPIKQAEAALQKRLEQQELMSTMSQSFISGEDAGPLIMRALEMAGGFMDMSKILLAHYDYERQVTCFDYSWYNPGEDVSPAPKQSDNIGRGQGMFERLFVSKDPYIAVEDLAAVPGTGFDHLAKGGVTAFIAVPLLRGEEAWGFLIFDECKGPRSWSPSDIQLVRLIGSVISGVIEQDETARRLRQMSSIVTSSPQYITFTGEDGVLTYANPGATEITGYTQAELIDLGWEVIFGEEGGRYVREVTIPSVLREGSFDCELPLIRKDGETRIMLLSTFLVGGDAGIGCIGRDITQQRALEKELVEAREKAEQSSLAKGNFLSRMSHEMRTPLNAVIGMTSIARGTDDPERKDYCLDKIDEASVHLLGVVNDILDMSKIEAGKFELAYSEFELEKMLVRVTGVMHFRVDEKKQDLIVKLDKGLPRYVQGDEQRLAQVVTNLLGNAVKFTPEGGTITLTVRLVETEGDEYTLQVEVKDTGIGISAEQQSRLFRSFEQADGGIARKFGGTGLGLAISRSIVEAMGGEIWVESELDQGATFAFRLKMKRGSEPARDEGRALKLSTVRVLAVDDAVEIGEYFKEVSDSLGFYCDVAASGFDAISLIEAAGEAGYDIIFVDWRMPEMDGVELARKIRSIYGEGVVIIMISAAEWSEIEEEARAAGVDGFVAKPLFSSLILDCINRYITPDEPDQQAPDQRDCFAGRRILLAEDMEINREIVYAMLADTGLTIDSAENGVEVLEKFRADPDYDLILMDIHMPEMDGYTATRELRALDIPQAKTVPIIAMTANVFREDVERSLAAGMNDHLGKPINFELMMEKLREYLCK